MVTAGETRIQKLVAVSGDGKLLPPCGRCRELLYQIDRGNLKAEIILGSDALASGRSAPQTDRMVTLEDLLPERWQELCD